MTYLTIWDFDDTLAYSEVVVARLAHEKPTIPFWKWWHDPKLSTLAALQTPPIISMWSKMRDMPGHHVILTARVGCAVEHWLEDRVANDPIIGDQASRIKRVYSTSSNDPEQYSRPASIKKAELIEGLLPDAAFIDFYDDCSSNIEAVRRRCPEVRCHLVAHHLLSSTGRKP